MLLFNALSYDSVYGRTLRTLIEGCFPEANITEFHQGSALALEKALYDRQVVVVVYPFSGESRQTVEAYGQALAHFAESGGAVLLTGSHDLAVFQQIGLLDVDAAFFCAAPNVHEIGTTDILEGTPVDFQLSNYVYPVCVRNPNYVSLAGLQNDIVLAYNKDLSVDSINTGEFAKPLSTLGYCLLGRGRVYYLGFEYFYDELPSTRILTNIIRRSVDDFPHAGAGGVAQTASARVGSLRRTEEHLVAGSGRNLLNIKLYPNPYVIKATVDLELETSAQISLDMVNENGRTIAVLLPPRQLAAGNYRFELPDVEPGIYFVKCNKDGQVDTRKVVKTKSL
ncbi:MAG: T9SS type A sorting domain-containing protein [Saprospiraceae bacterium]|nr:T9SS type A sorting domain-containing protein [Saprospiraceae bacterium]